MANLNNANVSGKIDITGPILEKGEKLDSKFIKSISIDENNNFTILYGDDTAENSAQN